MTILALPTLLHEVNLEWTLLRTWRTSIYTQLQETNIPVEEDPLQDLQKVHVLDDSLFRGEKVLKRKGGKAGPVERLL